MVSIHFSGGCDPGSSPGRGFSILAFDRLCVLPKLIFLLIVSLFQEGKCYGYWIYQLKRLSDFKVVVIGRL